ncbi:phosphatidylinositol 4,5-bisphosphate 3-kinase catalytic subunit delta isoform [Sergentomyia squamirostris]
MVPIPQPFVEYDFWSRTGNSTDPIELTCLMPTGILIPLITLRNSTLQDIKEELWEKAEKYPFYGHLRDKSMYVLYALSEFSKPDELTDETKRICDVKPYFCILKISEKQISTNNTLNKNINYLIGKVPHEFSVKNPELNDFRYKMSLLCDQISQKRQKMTWTDKVLYQFPPRLASSREIPETVRVRFRNDHFVLVAKFENQEAETSFTFSVRYDMTPHKLLDTILTKKALTTNKQLIRDRVSDYILKVCGQDEFLFGEYPLVQFLYIQDTLSRNGVPTVVTQSIKNLSVFEEIIYQAPESLERLNHNNKNRATLQHHNSTTTLRKKTKYILSWDVEERFTCTINQIKDLNCDINRTVEVGIQVGLFHGGKSLCEPKQTSERILNADGCVEFDETLTFDIFVHNIPRMARLCMVVYETAKSAKGGGVRSRRIKETNRDMFINPLVWVNTTVFDYKNQLKTGAVTLYAWAYAEDSQSDDLLHPLGTVEPNPRNDKCSAITMTFSNYATDNTIMYPAEDKILEHASRLAKQDNLNRDSAQDTRTIREILSPYLKNDRLHEMHEQERNAIWAKRYDCLHDEPEGLPCLLFCVEWNDKNEICEITSLLKKWKPVSVERALELLDYAYADQTVRRFAVNCLRRVRDEELLLYLLQLVQAMKHESYLHSDLVEFLLVRALNNQRIGHFLFWHLRSEMQVPSVQIRFGLILEAYLTGSQEHIPILLKQMQCLEKLKEGSELAKKGNRDKGRALLQEFFGDNHVSNTISNVVSPLNPSFRCKALRTDKCKVMDSKMRPLWIVFENADIHGDDIYVIFKNGDDLRQDMLTLQMLRIMDRIWKSHGYDFRMNPYSCISMERRLGMIEVVLNAETIANIQKVKGMFSATSPFKKGSLLTWLREHNPTDESLQRAITEFTYSCAGYCVATYVLGVADRHSDNIMVKRSGQLFHIDFGHILGHFKEKFGFRRERVPFVLTHDFVYVINNGRTDREADEFRTFQNLCETAFLILRQHGCLILSLFAMMISTGLPELSSEKDLNYLRETLVLDLPENEAREHFRSKFNEALANSWKTSLNWASHNFSKNNKQ